MSEGELGRVYADGEVIFKEGDRGEIMYVIQSGRVKITKQTSSDPLTIATLETGEIFGEMSLFDKLPRSAAAIAQGEARILSIDKKKLFSTISHDPTLVFKILETMSGRIRRLNENLAGLMETKTGMLKISINVEDTCRTIMQEAKNVIKGENGSIMLLDEDAQSLSIKSAFGKEANAKVSFRRGEGIAGDVLKSGRAELVNNAAKDSRFKAGELKIHSLLCAPMKYGEHILGVMNMSYSSEKLFTIDNLKLFHSLAAYASVAIQNAKNFSNLRNATDKVLLHATMLDM